MAYYYFYGFLTDIDLREWLVNGKENGYAIYIFVDDRYDEYSMILDEENALLFKLKFEKEIFCQHMLTDSDLSIWFAKQMNRQ